MPIFDVQSSIPPSQHYNQPDYLKNSWLLKLMGFKTTGERNDWGKVLGWINPAAAIGGDIANKHIAKKQGLDQSVIDNLDAHLNKDINKGLVAAEVVGTVVTGGATAPALIDGATRLTKGAATTAALPKADNVPEDTSTYTYYEKGGKMKQKGFYKYGGKMDVGKALPTDVNLDTREIQKALAEGKAAGVIPVLFDNASVAEMYSGIMNGTPTPNYHGGIDGEMYRANPGLFLQHLKTGKFDFADPHKDDEWDADMRIPEKTSKYGLDFRFKKGGKNDTGEDVAMVDKETGEKVGEISYGERIFSEADDAIMAKLMGNEDYEKLGKFVSKAIKKHEANEVGEDDGQRIDGGITPESELASRNASNARENALAILNAQNGGGNSFDVNQLLSGVGGADNIFSLGQTITGLLGTQGDLPEHNKSPEWEAYMRNLNRMKDQGLTPQETAQLHDAAVTGYTAQNENVRAISGGNSAFALGASGGLADMYRRALGEIGTKNSEVKRINAGIYGNALSEDNAIERQMFVDKFNIADEAKTASAMLANTGLQSIIDRKDYEDSTKMKDEYMRAMIDHINSQKNQNWNLGYDTNPIIPIDPNNPYPQPQIVTPQPQIVTPQQNIAPPQVVPPAPPRQVAPVPPQGTVPPQVVPPPTNTITPPQTASPNAVPPQQVVTPPTTTPSTGITEKVEDNGYGGKTKSQYDVNGKKTGDVAYDKDGNVMESHTIKYDENGRQSEYNVIDENGVVKGRNTTEYTADGDIKVIRLYDADGRMYNFDSPNSPETKAYISPSGVSKNEVGSPFEYSPTIKADIRYKGVDYIFKSQKPDKDGVYGRYIDTPDGRFWKVEGQCGGDGFCYNGYFKKDDGNGSAQESKLPKNVVYAYEGNDATMIAPSDLKPVSDKNEYFYYSKSNDKYYKTVDTPQGTVYVEQTKNEKGDFTDKEHSYK